MKKKNEKRGLASAGKGISINKKKFYNRNINTNA